MWFRPNFIATPDYFEERAETLIDQHGAAAQVQAAQLFRQALARDPASPYRWCTLGETLQEAGQTEAAGYCFDRAIELGPNIPPVLMRAANFDFAAGRTRDALSSTRRILRLVRDYDAAIFSTYARMGVPAAEVLERGFPTAAAPRQAYFQYVLGAGSVEDSARVWSWLEQTRDTNAGLTGAYCEFLIGHRRYGEARALWSRHMGALDPGYLQPNRIFNGGFETEPAQAGLDWRISPVEGVTVERQAGLSHTGTHCLRIAFDGRSNIAYSQVAQRVPVDLGTYRFRAFVRTDQITTDQGIGFRILDAESPERLDLSTRQLTGTSGWTELQAVFSVRPPARFLEIEVVRRASLKFDCKVRGVAWIDDVELVPAPRQSRSLLIQ